MSRIVLATASPELEEKVAWATDGGCMTLPFGPLPDSPAALFNLIETTPFPDVLLLDSGADPQAALDLATQFDRLCPAVSVILVTDQGAAVGLKALRAGIRDILAPAATVDEIRAMLEQAADAAEVRAHEPEQINGAPTHASAGRVISVVSAKGGVGKTTVATNIAVALARTAPKSTVLVDLDVQFGDVASALNLEPEYCLPDAVHGPASRDTMALKTFLTLHETGLYVICGPRTPAEADSITAAEVSHLLQMLAAEFEFVVVDTAPGLSDHVLAAMDQSNELVCVTSMDVPGVRGLRKELDALTQLGMLTHSRHIVLNFADQRGGLSLMDVELTLGVPVDVSLPRTRAALESVNLGTPLLQGRGKDPMTRRLLELVDRLVPDQAASVGGKHHVGRKAQAVVRLSHPKRAAPRWYRTRRRVSP